MSTYQQTPSLRQSAIEVPQRCQTFQQNHPQKSFPTPKFHLPLLPARLLVRLPQLVDEHLEERWGQSAALWDPLPNVEEPRQLRLA